MLLLLIIGLLYDCYRHKKVAIFLFSIIALLFFQIKHPLENEVTVVDIGQGDSILVRDVKGQTLLIDVGGKVRFSEKKSWQKRLADSNVSAGDNLPIMGSHLQVLYPNAVGDGGNNDSVVLYGNLLGKNFLFTGDLEEEGEEQMMATYPNLPVDVLKAGHHGSKGSSSPEFLVDLWLFLL